MTSKRIRIDVQDKDGAKFDFKIEGNVTREKVLKIFERKNTGKMGVWVLKKRNKFHNVKVRLRKMKKRPKQPPNFDSRREQSC